METTNGRGGYRGTPARARFTAQLVALDTPAMRDRVHKMAADHRVSQAKIMRAILAAGIAQVEDGLRSGELLAETLV